MNVLHSKVTGRRTAGLWWGFKRMKCEWEKGDKARRGLVSCGLPFGNSSLSLQVSQAWLWVSAWEESPGDGSHPFPSYSTFPHCWNVYYRSNDDVSQMEDIAPGRDGWSELRDSKRSLYYQLLTLDYGVFALVAEVHCKCHFTRL